LQGNEKQIPLYKAKQRNDDGAVMTAREAAKKQLKS
jgi:hypothetical protein